MTLTAATFFDESGVARLIGEIDGDFAGGPPVDYVGTDPAQVVLTVEGAPAQTADVMDVCPQDQSAGLFVGSDYSVTLAAPPTGSVGISGASTTVILVDGATDHLGFFSAAPVGQQSITGALSTVTDAAAKAVLTSIIAALVALGLATDGTT